MRTRFAFAAALLLSIALAASAPWARAAGASALLESSAGRFILRELGAETAPLSEALRGRVSADLERMRAGAPDAEASTRALFDRPAPAGEKLPDAEAARLRELFRAEGTQVREFVGLPARGAAGDVATGGAFGAARARFLGEDLPPLPHGKGLVFLSQRPDLLDGIVYRVEFRMENARLDSNVDRFEQGQIDAYVRRDPRALEPWGVRLIEKDVDSTVLEFPDVAALNARARLHGSGFTFELAASEEPVSVRKYLELLAAKRLPIAPVGQSARMYTHDLLVHALAMSAVLPRAVADRVAAESAAWLAVWNDSRVQASPALKAAIKLGMRDAVVRMDNQSAQIMPTALIRDPATRATRLDELYGLLAGGPERVRAAITAMAQETSLAALSASEADVLRDLAARMPGH